MTVPEMLNGYRAVKAKLPELRKNAGSKSIFEKAIFEDLKLAALVELEKRRLGRQSSNQRDRRS
jgi:hypothetical protein